MLKEHLIDKDYQKEHLEHIKILIQGQNEIAAWGTGRGAKKLLAFLNLIDWNGNLKFIDTNPNKCVGLFQGHRVFSPDDFFRLEARPDSLILITCADVKGVQNTISAYGDYENVQVCDLTTIDLESETTWFDYIYSHLDDYSDIYNLLADEKSKKALVGLLNYRISRNSSYLENIVDDESKQYFEDELFDVKNITFVDCGAYTGDTIEKFLKISGGGVYKKIYAFEPDEKIFEVLQKNIKRNEWKDVCAYNIGNYSEKRMLKFLSDKTGNEMSGHIAEDGNNICEVDALDNVIHEQVGLIKMDIEGAEYDALLGAKQLIKNYKPTLAVCIYHKRDDYFKILKLIHRLNSDYKFYIRQYSLTDNETILYAV